jgi:hypothetical protein
MNPIPLQTPSGAVKAYICSKCERIWAATNIYQESAELCCLCHDCKIVLKPNENFQCSTCRDISSMKNRIEMLGKAEDITDSNYDGPIYMEGSHDNYFADIGTAIESYICNEEDYPIPEWCHPVESKKFDMDIWDAIQSHCEDQHHEDFIDQMEDMPELQEFWEKWCAKQTGVTWWPDETKKINLLKLINEEKQNVQDK